MDRDGMGYGMDAGWTWVFWLLLIAGVATLLVVVVRAIGGGIVRGPTSAGSAGPEGRPAPGRGQARQILAERYARGEVDAEEYQHRLAHLQDD